MKVATFGLDSTVHSHFLTPKTSSGTLIFMSCLTGVWQDRRQPSRASRLLKWDSSVASISPPPLSTTHLHWAQVPPPPQTEDRKMPLSARVPSSLPPAGTVMVFSPLISMFTSPLETRRVRASRITTTNASTMPVNIAMGNSKSKIDRSEEHTSELQSR